MTPGILVNRPDLSDEAVFQSIAERDAIAGRSGREPERLVAAALEGDALARAELGGLILPPPVAPLAMHPQTLTREARGWLPRLAPFGRLRGRAA